MSSLKVKRNRTTPSLPSCRTLTTLICVTAATSTGAYCPLTRWRPRRWFCRRSLWSRKRQTWSSPPCWTSSSATLAPWRPSITNPLVPSWRAAMGSTGSTCPCSTAGRGPGGAPATCGHEAPGCVHHFFSDASELSAFPGFTSSTFFLPPTASTLARAQWVAGRPPPWTSLMSSPARETCSATSWTWTWAHQSTCLKCRPCRWVLWTSWEED